MPCNVLHGSLSMHSVQGCTLAHVIEDRSAPYDDIRMKKSNKVKSSPCSPMLSFM